LGAWGARADTKEVPSALFAEPQGVQAAFLRGLFHADGTFSDNVVKLTTVSRPLAEGAHHLLTRLGVVSLLGREPHSSAGYPSAHDFIFAVSVSDRRAVALYLCLVGFLALKERSALAAYRPSWGDASQVDRLPLTVNDLASEARRRLGLTHARFGWRDQGKRMSRHRAATLARRHDIPELLCFGTSDVLWDEIAEITPCGEEEVYDITVEGLHNFCVSDVITHNSGEIEQHADTVMLLWRQESEPGSPVARVGVDVAKQRNGPTGDVTVAFRKACMRFEDYAQGSW
jgi:replicative DNA helicase